MTRLLSILALAACLASPAGATTQDDVLDGQLLPGWQMDSGAHMAALRLNLEPGWKTYWRAPGDAGIPPQFNWSGSTNVKSVRLLWPAPSVFNTNGMQSIGYHDQLILPVEVTPIDPSLPVLLKAEVELGICKDICLPAFLSLSTEITAPGAPDASIRAALDSLPVTGQEAGLTGLSCVVEPIADGLRLTATILLPRRAGAEIVAFETSDPAVWISEAVSDRQGGALVAVSELVAPSGTPFELDRSGVPVTVISDGGAVEIAGCPAP